MIQGVPPQEYVDSLLHVYKKFSNIVTKHLNSDEVFTIALDRVRLDNFTFVLVYIFKPLHCEYFVLLI